MKVLSLEADNFKRIRAVAITPIGSIVEVTGDNGEGKSSTLDAIWAALGGKDACPDKPIHSGAEDAIRAGEAKSEVRLVLGEGDEPKFKVTRRFKLREGVSYTTDLIVENAEGARFGKPQDILNALLGDFCFDLGFMNLKDDEQVKALRKFVPEVDFAALEGLNKRDFEERTDVNRRVRDLEGQLAAMPVIAGDLPEQVDLAALEADLANASSHNSEVERRRGARQAANSRLDQIKVELARLHAEQTELEQRLQDAGPLPPPIDVVAIQTKLAAGREAQAVLGKVTARKELEARLLAAKESAVLLTGAIDKRKEQATKAVAKAKMPVEGLGFAQGDDEKPYVTLNGEPLAQAAQAEKIRVSVAIAAAMNPKLRVVRIADGSLLDKKSWAALTSYAEANDLQVWIETISAHGKAAVLIEDGAVAGGDNSQSPVVDPGDVV